MNTSKCKCGRPLEKDETICPNCLIKNVKNRRRNYKRGIIKAGIPVLIFLGRRMIKSQKIGLAKNIPKILKRRF
jgi:predicted nucleic acid-binding Zn ribbon protein